MSKKPGFLDKSTAERLEEQEKRQERIDRAYKDAERRERDPELIDAPDTRYWFQKEGVFTEDPKFDASVEAVRHRKHLPVKERVIEPDGTLVKVLGKAALECVEQGIFCYNCEVRQPDDDIQRREQFNNLSRMGIKLPDGATPSDNCFCCGARLGIVGDHTSADVGEMTDYQRGLLTDITGIDHTGINPKDIIDGAGQWPQ